MYVALDCVPPLGRLHSYHIILQGFILNILLSSNRIPKPHKKHENIEGRKFWSSYLNTKHSTHCCDRTPPLQLLSSSDVSLPTKLRHLVLVIILLHPRHYQKHNQRIPCITPYTSITTPTLALACYIPAPFGKTRFVSDDTKICPSLYNTRHFTAH